MRCAVVSRGRSVIATYMNESSVVGSSFGGISVTLALSMSRMLADRRVERIRSSC